MNTYQPLQHNKFSHHIGGMVEVPTVSGKVMAYLPPLLPLKPPVDIGRLAPRLEQAAYSVGQLDGITKILPKPTVFLHSYIAQEAVQSSQIEDIPLSLSDLLLHEITRIPDKPSEDAEEVSTYVAALRYGLSRIKNGFPLSQRLMREMHGILLSIKRGQSKAPGEYRRCQNWIGGPTPQQATYVPPPASHVLDLMSNLERFIHRDDPDTPVLVQAGILHVQFEMIHPFLDGNGRLGRLLITLLLYEHRILKEPLLYLSLFFNTHRQTYYALLERVQTHGDWQSWLEFFLDGVCITARHATGVATKLQALFHRDQDRVRSIKGSNQSAAHVYQEFQKRPFLTASLTADRVGVSPPTARKAIRHLQSVGILQEVTGNPRNQVFMYEEYLKILLEGTDLDMS